MSPTADQTADTSFVHGRSLAIQSLNAVVGEIARTDIPVLLMGESGTGKEVYGRLIHRLSKRGHTPLKKVSCRALGATELLVRLGSDLNGSAGSSENDLRTLFLDGIEELDQTGQKVLLSALPDGDVSKNGHNGARLIASTSRDLEKQVESGAFRRELYFRINGVCLRIPPLRDRSEDVLLLMEHFLGKYAAEFGREVPVLSNEEMEFLERHDWPGNVRELENIARKIAALRNTREAIEELRAKSKLEPVFQQEPQSLSLKAAARAASRQIEHDLISKVLQRTHWNRKRAALELQISYKSLLYKIKQTGLEASRGEQGEEKQ